MGAQNEMVSLPSGPACLMVSRVISTSKGTKPSTITRPAPARPPSCAYDHDDSTSSAERTTDCPLPEEDMTGLTTHGMPISSTAERNSSAVPANRYGEVGRSSVSAASRRMPSRSIVRRAARAVGMTVTPSASSSSSVGVWMASISGTTQCGCSSSTTRRTSAASSMSITWLRCATCMAGASAYRSTAIVSTPRRCSSITTSLPSSPEPSIRTRVAPGDRGVPSVVIPTP